MIRCGDTKILLDPIFVKYCWKPHRSLIFPFVQLPAFDILFGISRQALALEGDYEMMSVCACVRVCVS